MENLTPIESIPNHTEVQDDDYHILLTPDLRAEYISLTDSLIQEMAGQQTDVAIFLDKSARPVAWMVSELWDQLGPRLSDGSSLPPPEIKFLNIDREQWGAILGRSEDQGISIDLLPPERVDELKAIFKPLLPKDTTETMLTGKRVMLVDEIHISGDTLEMAHKILARAFPDAQDIQSHYWMNGMVKIDPKSGGRYNTKLPVWYSDREVTGRLIGNRDSTKSSQSMSQRQRIGRYWLSTAFREPDEKGLELKKEIKLMAEELKSHNLPYIPSPDWDEEIESVEERINRINGISVDEYVKLRSHNPNIASFVQAYRNSH
jgi:hypothetical protein